MAALDAALSQLPAVSDRHPDLITPAAEKLQHLAQGPEFDAAVERIKRLTISELGGFGVILVFMIAMRFGS